jgi:outer membrane protein assembly factor BamE
MRVLSVCLIVSCLAVQAGCSLGLPRVHKVTIQQGNVITQEMIDRLKPGMTRSQVAFVMGEPVLRHAFDEDRWDYIYTLQIPGYYNEQKRVSLYFENNVLAYFTGDYAPTTASKVEDTGQTAASPGSEPVIEDDS